MLQLCRQAGRGVGLALALACAASAANAQVDVSLTTSFSPPLAGHATFGGESLNAGGLTRDGDDYLAVTLSTPMGADCPSPDPLVIYRRDRDLEAPWMLEASLDPLGDGERPSVVAIDGDTLVVGDPPGFGPQEGRVLVYRRNAGAWDLEAELRASDSEDWDLFGSSVDIHQDTIVVGAWNEGSGAGATNFEPGPGAVYVYRRSGSAWTEAAKLTASDGDRGDEFGRSVSVKHTWLGPGVLVGAPGDFTDSEIRAWGSAYFFENAENNGWRQVQKETRAPVNGATRFGHAVALETSIASISSGRHVFAYDRDPAADEEQLEYDITIELDDGHSFPWIDVEGRSIYIGANRADGYHPDSGAIQVWSLRTWVGWDRAPIYRTPEYKSGDRVGDRVFVKDGIVLTGAPGHDSAGVDAGAVHTLKSRGNGHLLESSILAAPASPGGRFGSAVATDGVRAIVGMPEAEPCVGQGGYAFVYRWNNGAWAREANLSLEQLTPDARFGAAAAVEGDVAIIGAPSDGASASGSAHIFKFELGRWNHEQRVELPGAPQGARFGASIVIANGVAAIAAPGADSVAVLEDDGFGWSLTRVVSGESILQQAAEFGASLAITSDSILVGAPGFDAERGGVVQLNLNGDVTGMYAGPARGHRFGEVVVAEDGHWLIARPLAANGAGRVDVYAEQSWGWGRGEVLAPPADRDGYGFGFTLALDGEIAVVGARDGNQGRVHAYYLIEGEWTEFAALAHPQGMIGADFGSALALGSERLLVGAPRQSVMDAEDGAVLPMILDFRFTVPPCPGDFIADEIDAKRPDWLEAGDYFGWSVSVHGDAAAVGSPYADLHGENAVRVNAGAVTIYRRTGIYNWAYEQVLQPDDELLSASDTWGWDVAIERDLVMVCAPGADAYQRGDGAAYIYEFDGEVWVRSDTLRGDPRSLPYAGFATAGDMDNETIVLSCPTGDTQYVDRAGIAWVFERTGPVSWEIASALVAEHPEFADKFGASVAISGDWVVVGAPERDDVATGCGGAYIYSRDASGRWMFRQHLIAPDAGRSHRFGTSVDIEGDVIVVGAPYADGATRQSGAAYVYNFDSGTDAWVFQEKLTSAFDASSDLAGRSVAIDGAIIAVGAPGATHPDLGQSTGTVRLYSLEEGTGRWIERAEAAPSVGNPLDHFGQSVALEGGNVWVGANQVDGDPANPPGSNVESGQATTFDLQCAQPPRIVPQGLGKFFRGFGAGDESADVAPPFGVIDERDLREMLRRSR